MTHAFQVVVCACLLVVNLTGGWLCLCLDQRGLAAVSGLGAGLAVVGITCNLYCLYRR